MIRYLVAKSFSLERLEVDVIRSVIVASVVPPLDPTIESMARQYFRVEAVFVTSENAGIPILYDDPREVGADRIVDAVAVLERYSVPAIVVDLGTATTFDAITAKGEYLGGLISPGIEVSASALIEQAARLPRTDIKKPKDLIGRSTVSACRADSSGVTFHWWMASSSA